MTSSARLSIAASRPFTIYNVTLPKGICEVKWVLTGGGLGSSLIYFEGLGGKPLPIIYTSDMLKLLRSTPTSAEVNLSSATR